MPKFIVSWTESVKNSLEIEADSADAAMAIAKSGDVDDDIFTESIDRDDDTFRVAMLSGEGPGNGPQEPESDDSRKSPAAVGVVEPKSITYSRRLSLLGENDGPIDRDYEPDFRTPGRDEWKHEAAAAQRLK